MKKTGIRLVALLLAAGLLTGCWATMDNVEKREEKQLSKADATEESELTATKDREISEDLLEKQIQVILDNETLWRYDYREENDEAYQGAAFYKYAVTDLDQNGRLEILSVMYSGNEQHPYHDYYEVNQEMDGLDQITCDVSDSICEMTDLYTDQCPVYLDEKNNVYHYDISQTDMVLQKGVLKATCYSYWDSEYVYGPDDYPVERYKFYDGNEKRISPVEWLKLQRSHFEEMEQRQAVFRWFYTINEKEETEEIEDIFEQQKFSKKAKKNPITQKELSNRLRRSYAHFGFRTDLLTVSKQLELIVQQVRQWMPWQNGDMADLEPDMYSFVLTDLDSNGRLELIVSTTHGSGNVSENDYYEVNEVGNALVDITPEVKYQADWRSGYSLDQSVYYYEDYHEINEHHYITGDTTYHYMVQDGIWGGAGNGMVVVQDLYLKDGKITVEDIVKKKLVQGRSTYYTVEGGVQKKISRVEYQKRKKKHFMELSDVVSSKQCRVFHWFKLKEDISEKKLLEKLETAYMNWEYGK